MRISRDPRSDSVSVPDLPGCVATAKTLDCALCRGEQAIAPRVQGLRGRTARACPSDRTVTPRRPLREIDFYATVEVAT